MKNNSIAYNEGKEAYQKGKRFNCPYFDSMYLATKEWERGWKEAELEDEENSKPQYCCDFVNDR